MRECDVKIAGFDTTVVGPECSPNFAIVLLHGYSMDRSDLAPFAHSLDLPVHFYFPRGPHKAEPNGYAWWTVDTFKRDAALKVGPRDLAMQHPSGRTEIRDNLKNFIADVQARTENCPLILGGFSQGGMLACDALLSGGIHVEGLVLLSCGRIAFDEWLPHFSRVCNLPIFVSHGRRDQNIGFAAGEALKDWLLACGAEVTWTPFDDGHGMPLPVWRQLREFVQRLRVKHAQ